MNASKGNVYASGEQVKAALRNQDIEALTKALVLLRNQLSFGANEALTPQDPRLILAQQWLTASPGAQDIFTLWENAEPRQTAFIALIISILATTLSLLSTHYPYHSFGHPIVKKILEPTYTRVLKGYIGGANHDLILSSLKLYNSLSNFAGARERKTVLEVFPWELKSLPKLMNMRRKNKVDDPLNKPDIRTLYIFLLLSFIEASSPTAAKALFLEQHREAFTSIFKGLHQDPYAVIRRVLESCWSGLWGDAKLKRTLKIGVFNEVTLNQLCKIYDRVEVDPDVPADVVHHFLLAICTHPGTGVCFKDNGWYPRETSEEQNTFSDDKDETIGTKSKIFNKILGNVLRNLKANDDLRQQELVLKILEVCPELVAGYWSGAGLTLEPRLSTRWFTNIALFGSIIGLPVPASSFLLSDDGKLTLFRPFPPPLSNVIENIFPSPLGKVFLTKALQPTSRTLVQHSTALALCKCLVKYRDVVNHFRRISETLEESEEDGLWARRVRDLEREARKRIPEFQVVLAFAQRTNTEAGVKKDLLAESSHRLLWLYHHCLPELVSEARFDVGKLLAHFLTQEGDEDVNVQTPGRLGVLKQLHILRILEVSDQFIWTTKYGNSKHSSLYILLKMFCETDVPAIRSTVTHLVEHLLGDSILFQHNADEVKSWLQSLPVRKHRSPGAEAADGAPLTEEAEGVLVFFDECIQRCIKTPYRYLEDMHLAVPSDSSPSPLLMTLKEQLAAKLNAAILSASDALALATFVRKLVFHLYNSTLDPTFVRHYVDQMDDVLSASHLFSDFPLVTGAIRREVDIMQYCIKHLEVPTLSPPATVAKDIREFLTAVEGLEPPAAEAARTTSAYELVDWLRLIDQPLRSSEIMRLVLIIHRYHPPALKELAWAINPKANLLWDGPVPVEEIRPYVTFDWLFVSSNEEQLQEEARRRFLVDAACPATASESSLKKIVCQIEHTLSVAVRSDRLTAAILELLNDILVRSQGIIGTEWASLKAYVFTQCPSIRALSTAPTLSVGVWEALQRLVNENLEVSIPEDRRLVADTALHWTHLVETGSANLELAGVWLPFLPVETLLNLADLLSNNSVDDSMALGLLERIFDAVKSHVLQDEEVKVLLTRRIDQVMVIRSRLPRWTVIEQVLALTLDAMQPMFVDGSLHHGGAPDSVTLASSVAHWNLRFQRLPDELQLSSLLQQDHWTTTSVAIIRALLYKKNSTANFSAWVQGGNYKGVPTSLLAPALYAYLDAASCRAHVLSDIDYNHWRQIIQHHLLPCIADGNEAADTRHQATGCLTLLFRTLHNSRAELSQLLVKHVANLAATSITVELLEFGRSLGTDWPLCTSALAEFGVQWAVEHFGDNDTANLHAEERIESLIGLVTISSNMKAHVVEPLLTVIPQAQLSNSLALKLLNHILRKVQFKPLIVNRVLQAIVQHHRFVKFCSISIDDSLSPLRDSLVEVLHTLFHAHPSNTCQITHVVPLIPIYYGTTSLSDRRLLSIFRLFENQRKTSVGVLFAKWDASPDGVSNSSLDAILSLDSNILHQTCLQFPKWRIVDDQTEEHAVVVAPVYDPIFVILLVSQMLAESPPESAFAWIEFFRTNIVGVLIRALSAKDDQVRELALCAISALWTSIVDVDLQEKPPVQHILTLLRNSIPPPSLGESCKRLPTYTTLLLSHALKGIFYPFQFTYPITARFLLQRPELDTTDVPMLFGLLYSSSDEWRKERTWIIHLLSDGLVGSEDWKVFKRRHTWDLLASIFQSSTDRALRKSIFEVLANLTCIPQAASSLVLKSGLLTWVEMQLVEGCNEDSVPWLKILENVLLVVDSQKIDSSTNGQWRSIIGRCLGHILDSASTRKPEVFSLSVRVLLRLSSLSLGGSPDMMTLVQKSFSRLQETEGTDCWKEDASEKVDRLPHTKVHLFDCHRDNWGQVVESIWRVSMSLEEKMAIWDGLSSRMLIWRAMSAKNVTAEWVRVEVVKNLAVSI